ncbi:MAG: hypothetical protein MUP28_04365, partial [Candidatus Aminicenantes bacterium]|nr:hypothetical protein [Candidatus Aminicenantes bacterium]
NWANIDKLGRTLVDIDELDIWGSTDYIFTFSRNAMIPPVKIGIGTTLHDKRIFQAADRCQEHKEMAAKEAVRPDRRAGHP